MSLPVRLFSAVAFRHLKDRGGADLTLRADRDDELSASAFGDFADDSETESVVFGIPFTAFDEPPLFRGGVQRRVADIDDKIALPDADADADPPVGLSAFSVCRKGFDGVVQKVIQHGGQLHVGQRQPTERSRHMHVGIRTARQLPYLLQLYGKEPY